MLFNTITQIQKLQNMMSNKFDISYSQINAKLMLKFLITHEISSNTHVSIIQWLRYAQCSRVTKISEIA